MVPHQGPLLYTPVQRTPLGELLPKMAFQLCTEVDEGASWVSAVTTFPRPPEIERWMQVSFPKLPSLPEATRMASSPEPW